MEEEVRKSGAIILGVDPGMRGAWVAINEKSELVSRIVVPRISKTGPVDIPELINWMESLSLKNYERVILSYEDVHPLYGVSVSSTGSLMEAKGIIEGIFYSASRSLKNASIVPLTPKKWQSTVWLTHDKVMAASKVDTKATSLTAAKRLWPGDGFLASPKSKVAHDGIVDAMLIAEAARRISNIN